MVLGAEGGDLERVLVGHLLILTLTALGQTRARGAGRRQRAISESILPSQMGNLRGLR